MRYVALKQLEELIPAEHAQVALMWAAQQINFQCDIRDAVRHADPAEERAYVEATHDLRRMGESWDREVAAVEASKGGA